MNMYINKTWCNIFFMSIYLQCIRCFYIAFTYFNNFIVVY